MLKMPETLRIFGVLLYKHWLIRKKLCLQFLLFEILFPIGMIYFFREYTRYRNKAPEKVKEKREIHYRAQSFQQLISIATDYQYNQPEFFYAPSNSFTNKLMANVKNCFNNKCFVRGFATESEINAVYNKYKDWRGVAVIFDESVNNSTKNLNYKLRNMNVNPGMSLYNDRSLPIHLTHYYLQQFPLGQIQICIDRSFFNMKSGGKPIPDLYIQQVPYPAHKDLIPFSSRLRHLFVIMLINAFTTPLFLEVTQIANEKFAGLNVLMAANSISNTMNILCSIIITSLIVGLLLGIPIVLILTESSDHKLPFLYYGNPLIFYFIFFFHYPHLLTFGIHVSAYILKPGHTMMVLLVIIILSLMWRNNAFTDDTRYLAPYVGIIFPNILFYEAMEEVFRYENRAEGIQWYNLFTNSDPVTKIGGSIGMILILSIIGTIIHFLLMIYVYAINPGKYGVAKHPLYFLKFKRKKSDVEEINESLRYDEANDKNFEPIPPGVFVPGIQIKNLSKQFEISLFSKEKVDALRDVSIDFYKGQITVLLGHNGAGKTTLMSILTGMTGLTDGEVLINSKNLDTDASKIMKDIGLCTQENIFFPILSVSEQLLFFAMLKRKDKSRSEIKKDIEDLLRKVEMYDKRNELPTKLSEGQKRRLCLCSAFVGDASVLILDEPTCGLDPENRRVIWNMLLKMRGDKTILISTHDMEEADILGDRIAILHGGQLKSYGTSLFLKKLIGRNNVQITCSLEPRSEPEKIRKELSENGIITSREANKIVVSIPNSPQLPDILDNLEKKKKELGVSGFSVSLISLEQVFMKVIKENEDEIKLPEVTDNEETKLTGIKLYMQIVRGLLLKKFTYAIKNYSTIVMQILWILIALLSNVMMLKLFGPSMQFEGQLLPINLNMYRNPEVVYRGYDNSFGNSYKTVVQKRGGNPIEVTDTYVDNALIRRAKENLVFYDNYMIAAAELNKTSAKAFYSEMAIYSLPISINLLWNTIIQNTLGSEYSIKISSHLFPLPLDWYMDMSLLVAFSIATTFVPILSLLVSMFVFHPNREMKSGVKHLQKMTGISGFTYWGTIFLYDFIEYMILTIIITIGFLCTDLSLGYHLFQLTEISIEMVLLLLFAINALPIVYIFSFLNKETDTVLSWLVYIPTSVVIAESIIFSLQDLLEIDEKNFGSAQSKILYLIPYVSFLHSQISLFTTAHTNARCRTLPNRFYDSWCKDHYLKNDVCCEYNCYDGICEKSKPLFDDDSEGLNLKASMIYLCATPILYFGILALIESRIISKLIIKISHNDTTETDSDEQVQQEKTLVYERIEKLRDNNPSSINDNGVSDDQIRNAEEKYFLVYELRKKYQIIKAVKDVSFGVKRRECFALLGVNGAGKSTTFKMMTGGEIPDHGKMYIGDKDYKNNPKYFLSQMGYCPQQDAIFESLNAYDHLRLFARLRGIPSKQVEDEVQAWIDRLNLISCASRPSRTYSGGNKRRLNVAIALIGNPNLILMDEPTTGIDPGARRSLWNVIKACQKSGQVVVLISQSMEECEILCNRLAIMVDGKFVCIGASEQLKQRFGAGYDIQIRINPEKSESQVDSIKNDMSRMLNCELIDENLGYLMYHIEPTGTTWRKMYNVMNEMKSKYNCVDDFLVLSASLEQLFMMFARAASENSSRERNV